MHTRPLPPTTPRRSFLLRVIPAVVLAPLAMSPVGCESYSTGGSARSPEARRAAFPLNHEDYRRIGYRLDWIGYPAVTSREEITRLYADDEVVATVEAGSTVTLLSASSGGVRWTNRLSDRLTIFVGVDRVGDLILASSESELFLLDLETGGVRGRQKYDKIVSTRPAIVGNLLIYGTGIGEVLAHVALGAGMGTKAWGNTVTGAIEAAPVLVGPAVGVVTQRGNVLFVDAASGVPIGANRLYAGVATDPVADDQTMYVAGLDQSIWALRAEGGTVAWRHRTAAPLRHQPTLAAGRLYCAIDGRGLTAFEAATGAVVWTAPGVSGTVVGTQRGRLLTWDGQTMYLLDATRGDVIESARLPGVRIIRPDRFDDGNLYVVSTSGLVARFVPR